MNKDLENKDVKPTTDNDEISLDELDDVSGGVATSTRKPH